MARVCVFDVNETLLDLAALDPHFERAFGDADVRRAWFLQLLQSALVATVTGAYSTAPGRTCPPRMWQSYCVAVTCRQFKRYLSRREPSEEFTRIEIHEHSG
jgi:hypothetical protein